MLNSNGLYKFLTTFRKIVAVWFVSWSSLEELGTEDLVICANREIGYVLEKDLAVNLLRVESFEGVKVVSDLLLVLSNVSLPEELDKLVLEEN